MNPKAPETERKAAKRAKRRAAKEKGAKGRKAGASPSASERPLASSKDIDHILKTRRDSTVPVDQPLVLISQVQRSGGTLLGRLFDGHPQCHVHPFELHIGSPSRHRWPFLGLDEEPRVWWAKLREDRLGQMFDHGHRRMPTKGKQPKASEVYPFLLSPSLQQSLFESEIEKRGVITSERQILDSYLTSLFNAWVDNQNLYGVGKRWVVAFAPRLAWEGGREKFFDAYPEGRLISIVRDPRSWFASARGREDPENPSPAERLLTRWKTSAEEILAATERQGPAVYVVSFDDLVSDTEGTMRDVATYLELEWDQQLCVPTFNRFPVGANSSYAVRSKGVISDPLTRYREILGDEELDLIDRECAELFEQVLALCRRPAQATV